MSVTAALDREVSVIADEYSRHSLHGFFAPESVAVVGATARAGSVGRTILENLTSAAYKWDVYPVNPKRPEVLGRKAYPSVSAIPNQIELAVIVTPAPTVPAVVRECVSVGVKNAIVISAGFKEVGAEGVALEQEVLEEARKGNMRIIGPNCLGVMNPITGLNATFSSAMARPGSVGLISQSGAMCTAILDWSLKEKVGFSSFVSIGSMLDVGWGDLIYYLGDDPNTKSIVIYMESIGDARSFLSAAREVALSKPIIVIKVGRTEAAGKAAASHTGAMTGSDDVLESAFRRCGVLRVDTIASLFYMAEVLAKQPRPKGPRLSIVTNAGGPGVLATDALISDGGDLAPLSDESMAALNDALPSHWSHSNPIDILGDADSTRYAKSVEVVAKDPNSDGMLVILTPQAMSDPMKSAEEIKEVAAQTDKPVIASWMGGTDIEVGQSILNQANIPTFPYPDTAAKVFNAMYRYSKNLDALYETPMLPADASGQVTGHDDAAAIIAKARAEGRTLLDEFESKQVLAAYGIPVVDTRVATTADEAAAHAEAIGYPVVIKLYSRTITHKTDVGGVLLNLATEKDVRDGFGLIERSVLQVGTADDFLGVTVQPMIKADGYELILGSSIDPQFGPVLLYGTGGQLVEVFKDRAIGLPPLNTTLARRLMERTKIQTALKGVRGREGIDMTELELLLVHFSHLVVQQTWVKEIDINPLLASPQGLLALDARVLLYPADTKEEDIPVRAIRPYPIEYCSMWQMKDGTPVTIRPIRPEDESLMVQFHETLSEETVRSRYLRTITLSRRVQHDRLRQVCFVDYDRTIPLVIELKDQPNDVHRILGVGRMIKAHDVGVAEFALVISDDVQGQGLGSELLHRLVEVARVEGINQLTGTILADDEPMQHVCTKLGFALRPISDEHVGAELAL